MLRIFHKRAVTFTILQDMCKKKNHKKPQNSKKMIRHSRTVNKKNSYNTHLEILKNQN